MHRDEAELRRRINENLQAVRSGRRARELAEEKRLAAERKVRLKQAAKRLKAIQAHQAELQDERAQIEAHIDQLLLGDDNELLEMCEVALEGLNKESADLEVEADLLRSI